MKPLMPEDYVAPRRLRIEYIRKQNPYNSGEERTLAESSARSLCIQGVAIPSPKKPAGIKVWDLEKHEVVMKPDVFGGWTMSSVERRRAEFLREKAGKESGDFAEQEEADEEARATEEARVMAEEEDRRAAAKKPAASDNQETGFSRVSSPRKGSRKTA